jgi:hypothetical protein
MFVNVNIKLYQKSEIRNHQALITGAIAVPDDMLMGLNADS